MQNGTFLPNNNTKTRCSELKKLLYRFECAIGMNFTGVLRSQRLRKIYTSSAIFFLKYIENISHLLILYGLRKG